MLTAFGAPIPLSRLWGAVAAVAIELCGIQSVAQIGAGEFMQNSISRIGSRRSSAQSGLSATLPEFDSWSHRNMALGSTGVPGEPVHGK
jgi:hypothetical protein